MLCRIKIIITCSWQKSFPNFVNFKFLHSFTDCIGKEILFFRSLNSVTYFLSLIRRQISFCLRNIPLYQTLLNLKIWFLELWSRFCLSQRCIKIFFYWKVEIQLNYCFKMNKTFCMYFLKIRIHLNVNVSWCKSYLNFENQFLVDI